MFSPEPPRGSWWYIMEGELLNGTFVEIFYNGGLHFWEPNLLNISDSPLDFKKSFKNHRWYKFFENGFNIVEPIKYSFGKYICSEFNSRHSQGSRLYYYRISMAHHNINLDGTKTYEGKQLIYTHTCFDQRPTY